MAADKVSPRQWLTGADTRLSQIWIPTFVGMTIEPSFPCQRESRVPGLSGFPLSGE